MSKIIQHVFNNILFKKSLKKKMIIGFVTVIVLMISLNLTTYMTFQKNYDELDKMVEITIKANQVISKGAEIDLILSSYVTNKTDSDQKNLIENLSAISSTIGLLNENIKDTDSLDSLDSVTRIAETYTQQVENAMDLSDPNDKAKYNFKEASKNKSKSGETLQILKTSMQDLIYSELNFFKVSKSNLDTRFNTYKFILLSLTIFLSILSIIFTTIFSRSIANTIFKLAKNAQKIADGNLNVTEVKTKSKDEISILAQSFNKMNTNLKSIMKKIGSSSKDVTNFAQNLQLNVMQNHKAIEQVTATIQHVSEGAIEQSEQCKKTVTAVNELYSINKQAQQSANNVIVTSKLATESANDGNKKIDELIEQINIIHAKIIKTQTSTEFLKTSTDKIVNIITEIKNISSQTNMLALNASIEAARAGEFGKGFSVVANEIRKLSLETDSATMQISQMIEDINLQSQEVAMNMSEGVIEVNSGTKLAEDAKETFSKIVDTSEKVGSEIASITGEINIMLQEISNVEKLSEGIYLISKDSSNGSLEVASVMEEQSASLYDISSNANLLSDMSKQLEEIVHQFQV